jgi:hypothetical protein
MSYVSSNVRQGSYGPVQIASMESAELIRAKFMQKVYKQYGEMYRMHDMLNALGGDLSVPAQNQKVVEEYAPYMPIKIKSIISAGAAGAAITIVVDASSMVSNVHQARVGFTVKIPAEYMPVGFRKDGIYKIIALGTDTIANDQLTCEPFLAGDAYTKQQIAKDVPAGTVLALGFSTYSRGEGQPVGTTDFPIVRDYTSHIVKETKGFDGGVLAHEGEVMEYNGVRWLLSRESMNAEFSLKDQIDDAITFSEPNDNAADLATATTMSGQLSLNRSTRGVVSWLDDAGQKVYYTDAPDLTVLDDIIDAWISQGVYCKSGTIFCSLAFFRGINDAAKDHVREYSGGSDFLDGAKEKLGITIYTINRDGIDFFLHPVATWSKPGNAGLVVGGNNVYAAGTMAIAVPNSKVTVNKWGNEGQATIPNLNIAYVNYNGENRKRMMGYYKGVNGVFSGLDVSTDLDGYKLYWGSEFMLIGAEWNKLVLIRKQ